MAVWCSYERKPRQTTFINFELFRGNLLIKKFRNPCVISLCALLEIVLWENNSSAAPKVSERETRKEKKMVRSPCCAKVGINKGAWSSQEDEILINYVKIHGEGKWRKVAQNAGTVINRMICLRLFN